MVERNGELRAVTMRQFFLVLSVMTLVMAQSSKMKEVNFEVTEEQTKGTLVGDLAKYGFHHDRSSDKKVTYKYLSDGEADNKYFTLGAESGKISTAGVLDREAICPNRESCRLTLRVGIQIEGDTVLHIVKVNIDVIDINDQKPTFPAETAGLSISESSPPETQFSLHTAEDLDSPRFGIKHYDLYGESDNIFQLRLLKNGQEVSNVQLVLKEKLDRERIEFYQMKLVATDGGDPHLQGFMVLNITVIDVNDNGPKFNSSEYSFKVKEDVGRNTAIGRVWAKDPDAGSNGRITYSFSEKTGKKYGDLFGIMSDTGELFVRQHLDYETKTSYQLFVRAEDHGAAPIVDLTKVNVNVEDVNDHAPMIKVSTLSGQNIANISESDYPGKFVAHLAFSDPDRGINGQYKCWLPDISKKYFRLRRISEMEFEIITLRSFDRELQSVYNITVQCKDHGLPPLSSSQTITVAIADANDNSPEFMNTPYTAKLQENNYVGAQIMKVTATDRDADHNGRISYKIPASVNEMVAVDKDTGLITAKAIFDYEQNPKLEFPVIAEDGGFPARSDTATVSLRIIDMNDEKPQFAMTKYPFGCSENEPRGTIAGQVVAEDKDSLSFDKITYRLEGSNNVRQSFKVDESTGEITTLKMLDREQQSSYNFIIWATDSGSPSLSSSVSVLVYIADKNDNFPVIDYPNPYNDTTYISADVPVGSVISQVKAHDDDVGANAKLSFSFIVESDPGIFQIIPYNGKIVLMKQVSLMLEQKTFHLTIKVEDSSEKEPRKSVQTDYKITMDQTIPYVPPVQAVIQPRFSSRNILILVGVSSVCVITILLLTVILVYYKRREQIFFARTFSYVDSDKSIQKGDWQLHDYLESVGQLSPDEEMDGWKYASIASSIGRNRDNFGVVQHQTGRRLEHCVPLMMSQNCDDCRTDDRTCEAHDRRWTDRNVMVQVTDLENPETDSPTLYRNA